MRKLTVYALALILVLSLLTPGLSASAAQPSGYWPYFTAYENAVASGNTDEILRTGDEMLAFYAQFPMNSDIASMSCKIYKYRSDNALYEKCGDYDSAIQNAKNLKYVAEYIGSTDTVIDAEARAEKLDPMTEVYALSNEYTPAAFYGAKNEPASGTYFGRVADISTAGLKNASDVANESVVSFYVEAGNETAADYAWIIGPYDDGKHVIHIALNFPNKAETAAQIAAGTHDANIKETLIYLASLKCPVFLRIGGEMNLWEMDPNVFISAFSHVAMLARTTAPKVALVWSPNCVGSWGSSVDDFYPGDAYVDWVGVSLYNDPEPTEGQDPYGVGSMYFGRGAFADCVLSMKAVGKFALIHNKPVIITEGGMGLVSDTTGKTFDAQASAQITKRYTALNMVYPNIKAIVYFDHDQNGDRYKYALTNSASVNAAYGAAVSANPTLLSDSGAVKPSYVKLADYCAPSGVIDIYAYSDTVYSSSMSVKYYLSGSLLATLNSYPYHVQLDTSGLSVGSTKFEAVFNDGAGYTKTKTYTLTKLQDGNVIFTEGYSQTQDTPSSWAGEEVGLAVEKQLIPDVLMTRYTTNITRYNFCKLVIQLIQQKTGKSIDQVMDGKGVSLNYNAFTDTADIRVLEAYALGIVGGRGGGIFDGGAGISREEAAKMLKNTADILGIKQNGASAKFSDAATFSSWAVTAINFVSATSDKMSGKVVMGGIGGNLFGPKGAYTYQQAYITMLRLYRAG